MHIRFLIFIQFLSYLLRQKLEGNYKTSFDMSYVVCLCSGLLIMAAPTPNSMTKWFQEQY